MCQIDRLRRLKCEASVITNALANLPKTLDETYERIMMEIPQEEWPFVRRVFRWVWFHLSLYNASIELITLLQTIHLDDLGEDVCTDHEYDEETLRELCGCLISISPGDPFRHLDYGPPEVPVVSFAHYTVLEYLNSPRISNTPAKYFHMLKSEADLEVLKVVAQKALSSPLDHQDVKDMRYRDNVAIYCWASTFYALRIWNFDIASRDDLYDLFFDFVDPSSCHYEDFCTSMKIGGRFYLEHYADTSLQFWSIEWKCNSPLDIFVQCSLFSDATQCHLAEKLLARRQFSREEWQATLSFQVYQFDLNVDTNGGCHRTFSFNGSIIEVLAQLLSCAGNFPACFKLLLEKTTFDPSVILMSFIGSHYHSAPEIHGDWLTCEDYCPLQRLLELNGDPHGEGYAVTPLQIAVARGDFEGVDMLLRAGADARGAGDTDGITWEEDSFIGRFNFLCGVQPLCICRQDYFMVEFKKTTERARIEQLLLEYGAQEEDGDGPKDLVTIHYVQKYIRLYNRRLPYVRSCV